MKKFFKTLAALVVVMSVVMCALVINVSAFTANSTIGVTNETPKVNSIITVTVTFKFSSKMQAIEGTLKYDSSKLKYISAGGDFTSNAKDGSIDFLTTGNSDRFSEEYIFKVIAEGDALVSLSGNCSDGTSEYYVMPSSYKLKIVQENVTDFAGGSGTETDPYLISGTAHFNNIRKYPSAHFSLLNNITFTESDFAEGGTFYNEENGFIPFDSFSGTLNGNGYTVSGLEFYYEYSSSSSAYTVNIGLFRNNSGNISNLSFENLSAIAYSDCAANLGGLVGKNTGNIVNCSVSGSVISLCGDGSYVGTVAGENCGQILNCINSSFIYIYPTGEQAYSGGITGISNEGSTIGFCYNLGAVSGYVTGGIAGVANNAQIVTCANLGVVGYGSVLQEQTDLGVLYGVASGGIAGYAAGNTVIGGCYNAGEVVSYSDSYEAFAGGIAAEITESCISDCYNLGYVGSYAENYDAAAQSGDYAAGIVASVNSFAQSEDGQFMSVENCYSIAVPYSANEFVGGIAGVNNGGIFKNNYYYDIVTNGIYENFDVNEIDGVTSLTDGEMKNKESYEGFDFENVWWLSSVSGYDYPQVSVCSVAGAQSVEITQQPQSTVYNIGAEPDLSGGKMTVTYYSGESEELDTGELSILGYDNTVAGEQTVYFVYGGYMFEGSITFVNKLAGDCNNDGIVNISDLAILKLYLAGVKMEDFSEASADVDGNGAVETTDMAQLKLTLAGE